MKKILNLSILFIIFSFVFTFCSRDESVDSLGFFQINGAEKININNVNVHEELNYNSTNTNHYTFIFTHIRNSTVNGIKTSKTVQLEVELPSTENLNGDFNYNSNSRKIVFGGTWYMNYDGTSQPIEQISEGTCTIKRNSTKNFTVNFLFKTLNGKLISGEYSGNVVLHDANN